MAVGHPDPDSSFHLTGLDCDPSRDLLEPGGLLLIRKYLQLQLRNLIFFFFLFCLFFKCNLWLALKSLALKLFLVFCSFFFQIIDPLVI